MSWSYNYTTSTIAIVIVKYSAPEVDVGIVDWFSLSDNMGEVDVGILDWFSLSDNMGEVDVGIVDWYSLSDNMGEWEEVEYLVAADPNRVYVSC